MADEDDQTPQLSELQVLKARAKQMGISHSPNIGVEALKLRINSALEGKPLPEDATQEDTDEDEDDDSVEAVKPETKQERRKRLRDEAYKLVRVRIYNMDPSKADLYGEIVTVANRVIGNVSKFVPFGEKTDNGYHIPHVLFVELQNRKFQQKRTITNKGQIEVKRQMVPEYNIQVLPPLTKEELRQLGDQQAAAERLAGSE